MSARQRSKRTAQAAIENEAEEIAIACVPFFFFFFFFVFFCSFVLLASRRFWAETASVCISRAFSRVANARKGWNDFLVVRFVGSGCTRVRARRITRASFRAPRRFFLLFFSLSNPSPSDQTLLTTQQITKQRGR
jgi:hypothetical protein